MTQIQASKRALLARKAAKDQKLRQVGPASRSCCASIPGSMCGSETMASEERKDIWSSGGIVSIGMLWSGTEPSRRLRTSRDRGRICPPQVEGDEGAACRSILDDCRTALLYNLYHIAYKHRNSASAAETYSKGICSIAALHPGTSLHPGMSLLFST